jgi:hypothetical protein
MAALACKGIILMKATPVPADTPLPTLTSTPLPTPTRTPDMFTVIYTDDFSDPDSGWPEWSEDDISGESSGEYLEGEYVLKFFKPADIWAWPGGGRSKDLVDASVEFTAQNPLQSSKLYFGTYCDYQDENNYYLLFVTTDGYYRISKDVAGAGTILTPDDSKGWAKSKKIAKSALLYKFRAECAWQELILYVDGVEIGRVEDDSLNHGEIRLYSGSFEDGNSEIHIDDFRVGTIIG